MAETTIQFRITEENQLEYTAVDGSEEAREEAIREMERMALEAIRQVQVTRSVSWLMKLIMGAILAVLAGASIASIPAVMQVYTFAKGLEEHTKPLVDIYNATARRIRGIIDNRIVQGAIRMVRAVNRVGMIVSSRYRLNIERFYEATGNISRAVFGDAVMLSSALNLLRLSVADATRLRGDSVDIADTEWFTVSQNLLEDVEKNASRYARRPQAFWGDFNRKYLSAQIESADEAQRERNRVITLLGDTMRAGDKVTEALEDRFQDYRKEVDPFLTPEKRRGLDRILREYYLEVRLPITRMTSIVNDFIPEIEKQVGEIDQDLERQAVRVKEVEDLTASPSTLSEPKQIVQGNRFTEILSNIRGRDEFTFTALSDAQTRYERILEQIEIRGRFVEGNQ